MANTAGRDKVEETDTELNVLLDRNLNTHFVILIEKVTSALQQLTNNILVVLRDELLPVALSWRGKVDVDQAVTRGVQVGLECEQRALVGDVLVLGVKVVD